MSRRISWQPIAIIAAVLVAVVIGIAVFTGGDDPQSAPTDDSGIAASTGRDDSAETAESPTDDGAGAAPLVATTETGEIVPPKSTTKKTTTPAPANPASPATPETPATPPGGLTPEEQAYLEETRKVVEENTGELASVAEFVTEALGSGDIDSLAPLLPEDEGDQSAYVATLAEQYPPISSYELGGNVNIFATGETTLYFAYALVVWTDGGITSEHTIPIVLRYVDGQWRLSSLGDTSPDLDFVQSVTL